VKKIIPLLLLLILLFSSLFLVASFYRKDRVPALSAPQITPAPPVKKEPVFVKPHKPRYVRGIHLSAWIAGSKKHRQKIKQLFAETELNTVVIAVKEYNGEVYIPGVKTAQEIGAYRAAMPDIRTFLDELKKDGVYTSARIVLFKDSIAATMRPEWAVRDASGNIWKNNKGTAWVDPYNRNTWEYNFAVAEACIDLGFEEIQFDYVRFPSDGEVSQCRYSQPHSSTTAINNLGDFLRAARKRLKEKRGANISVDVFGLTTAVEHDMGIGQNIVAMAKEADFICPMVYPSHYPKGSFGYRNPNSQPYPIVCKSMEKASRRLGLDTGKLRPYLQDFSLGYKYTSKEVREQIQACYDMDIPEWTLWNPRSSYSSEALLEPRFSSRYENNRSSETKGSSSPQNAASPQTK